MTISENEALISELKVIRTVMNGDAELLRGTCDSLSRVMKPDYIEGKVDEDLTDIWADYLEAITHIKDAIKNLNNLLSDLEG